VVESASDIVLSTDPKGALVTWNRAAEEITGYKFRDVEGKLLFSFCSPQHHELVQRIFRKIENLGGTQYAEWSLQTNTSQEVLASWVCSPMQNEAGRVIGVVAVGRDLTERRKLEMQILQSQKLAALGVMAGGIAHEIRNPLAISSSAAQFLIEEPICELEPEFVVKCAEKIHQGIHRASKIIENLMRFARPSFQNELESVDLVTLCNDTIGLVANEAKLKKVELDIQLPSTPMIINGQPHMLQQMLMNLMLNAFRAMPNGGRIKFSLQSNHEEVMLYIADTGTGIPTHNLDKIFDPFFTTSPVGEGVGLGLSLCYSIIKQHFGAIEVESTPNKGSLFTIRLPLS
jgi:PAS domain S-box-containing protein